MVTSELELVDTHMHLDEEAFEPDRDDVVARAVGDGVRTILTIGTTAESSVRAVALAARYPQVFAAVGIQPNYTHEARDGDWEVIERLAREAKVVAIGETGLDRYWDYAPFGLQQEHFRRHIELSRRLGLPFVIHCREAEAEVLAELRTASQAGPLQAVMHSFCGSAETARECLEMGLYLSFAGMVTFTSAKALRAVAAQIPLERILVETDAPYLTPSPFRGKRNEPAFVKLTAKCLAELFCIPLEEFARRTTENARRLFRFEAANST